MKNSTKAKQASFEFDERARRVSTTYTVYRSNKTTNPSIFKNALCVLDNAKLIILPEKPDISVELSHKRLWCDPANLKPGDYITSPEGVMFVTDIYDKCVGVIVTNETMSLFEKDTVLFADIPASFSLKTIPKVIDHGPLQFVVIYANVDGVGPRLTDTIRIKQDRFKILTAELTGIVWRLSLTLE